MLFDNDLVFKFKLYYFYCYYRPLDCKGVIKGGGLENALIIKGDQVMNPGGARFLNEPVRHKVLDLIGDLSMVGPFLGHIISIRSGHSSNITFAKMIMESR